MLEYVIIGGLSVVCLALLLELRRARTKGENNLDINVMNEQLKNTNRQLQADVLEQHELLGQERDKNRTLLSQKKSSETRLGQISEHLVPFLEGCQHDPKNMHFMGNPIDYLVFDFDAGSITFLEVKSGNSKPSKRQKTIKNMIKEGRIFYEEIRINQKGVRNKLVSSAQFADEADPIFKDDEGEEDGED